MFLLLLFIIYILGQSDFSSFYIYRLQEGGQFMCRVFIYFLNWKEINNKTQVNMLIILLLQISCLVFIHFFAIFGPYERCGDTESKGRQTERERHKHENRHLAESCAWVDLHHGVLKYMLYPSISKSIPDCLLRKYVKIKFLMTKTIQSFQMDPGNASR